MELPLLVFGTLAYPVMQLYMLVRRSARIWRVLAFLPLLVILPFVVKCVSNGIEGRYHALVPVFLISAVALLYLVIVWIVSNLFRRAGNR